MNTTSAEISATSAWQAGRIAVEAGEQGINYIPTVFILPLVSLHEGLMTFPSNATK